FRAFVEFFAGHGRAVDAVATGLRSHVDDGISFSRSLGVEDFVLLDKPKSKGIYQRIARVAGLKLGLAPKIGNAKAVPIGSDPTDDALEYGMILMHLSLCSDGRATFRRPFHRPKPQGIHHRHRPG